MSEEPTPWAGPTLHGPEPACWYEYSKRLGTWRICGYRLDLSPRTFVPLTFPPARPDYEPGELAKIEAAEEKRRKRENRALSS